MILFKIIISHFKSIDKNNKTYYCKYNPKQDWTLTNPNGICLIGSYFYIGQLVNVKVPTYKVEISKGVKKQ